MAPTAAEAPKPLAPSLPGTGRAGRPDGAPRFAWRVVLAAVVCWSLFVNHYARDTTGALEREIERDFGIAEREFQALNAVYFGPNILVPFLAGALAQRVGAGRLLIGTQVVAAFGHIAVGCGMQTRSYEAVITGRAILGLTYESIDVMPLPLLAPRFGDSWGATVGMFNSALRMGSVTNFALSPLAYRLGGLPAAFWLSCSFGLSGLAAALFVPALERRAPAPPAPAASPAGTGSGSGGDSESANIGCFADRASLTAFGLYVVTAALVYSSIVPFWFYGGAFIRDKWGYSLQAADALMLFPEGSMVFLSPPIGLVMDKLLRSGRFLVVGAWALMSSLVVVVAGFVLLIAFPAAALPPVVPLAVLGFAYAASNTVLWSLSSGLVPATCYALGGGIIGSSLNIGPTLLPMVMAAARSEARAISLLAGAAGASSLGSMLLALSLRARAGRAGRAALLDDAPPL